MFNILSGLQEGSYSVATVSRAATSPNVFVSGAVVTTDASGTIIPVAAAANAKDGIEFVFEDLTGQSSRKYTCVFGYFEAETDQVDEDAGTINVGDKLNAVGGKLSKASGGDITGGLFFAKCIATKAASVDPCLGSALGKVVQFRVI